MIPLVHLLTNRAGGFSSPALPQRSTFSPSVLPPVLQRVHKLLQLDVLHTDFYVNAFLRLLQMQPDLWLDLCAQRPDTTVLEAVRPMLPQMTQGQLVHDGTTVAAVVRRCQEWPVAFEIKVDLPGGVARITLGETTWPDVRITGRGDDMQIDWPVQLGVAGRVRRSGGWTGVDSFSIWHEPVGFPCRPLYDTLQHDLDVQGLLASSNCLDAFLRTVDPARGVALVVASVTRSHPQYS